MKKCIQLAKKARGKTSPNPLVGCVILDKNSNIVSTGYHKKYAQNHAERDALLKPGDFRGCTLVVNLEPCSHWGKTPPCTDIIIEKGIKKVVFGMLDPNPLVAGKGLEKLKNAGIELEGPILEDECKKLNEIFIKNFAQNKTFVAIKTATTIDGKIATYNGNSKWITSDRARNYSRQLRQYYDAILTSSATIIADNPEMKHSKKIVLDRSLKTDFNSKIYKNGDIIVFCEKIPSEIKPPKNVELIKAPVTNDGLDIDFVLKKLFERKIMSVFVEAGGQMCGSFLPYCDRLYHFVAPKILNDNTGKSCFNNKLVCKISDCTNLKFEKFKNLSPDILVEYGK